MSTIALGETDIRSRIWAWLDRWRPEPLLWSAPLVVISVPFFILPLVAIIWVSFFGGLVTAPRTGNFLASYWAIVSEGYYLSVYANTLGTAVGVTALTFVLGFPLAYFMVRWAGPWLPWLIWILYLPIIVSVVVRVFGWMVITADRGLINQILVSLTLVDRPVRLLYEIEAMTLAMVHRYLPLMVLPLVNAIGKIDMSMDRAASSLGAGRIRVMTSITLPLALPGIFAGTQLVFASVLSDFVMPSLLGTTRFPMMAPAIFEQSVQLLNWMPAAAIASVLLIFVVAYLLLTTLTYRRFTRWAALG